MVIRQVVILNYRIKDFIYFFFIYSSYETMMLYIEGSLPWNEVVICRYNNNIGGRHPPRQECVIRRISLCTINCFHYIFYKATFRSPRCTRKVTIRANCESMENWKKRKGLDIVLMLKVPFPKFIEPESLNNLDHVN